MVGDVSVELCGECRSMLERGWFYTQPGQAQIGSIGRWLSRAFRPGYGRSYRSEQGPAKGRRWFWSCRRVWNGLNGVQVGGQQQEGGRRRVEAGWKGQVAQCGLRNFCGDLGLLQSHPYQDRTFSPRPHERPAKEKTVERRDEL